MAVVIHHYLTITVNSPQPPHSQANRLQTTNQIPSKTKLINKNLIKFMNNKLHMNLSFVDYKINQKS